MNRVRTVGVVASSTLMNRSACVASHAKLAWGVGLTGDRPSRVARRVSDQTLGYQVFISERDDSSGLVDWNGGVGRDYGGGVVAVAAWVRA